MKKLKNWVKETKRKFITIQYHGVLLPQPLPMNPELLIK